MKNKKEKYESKFKKLHLKNFISHEDTTINLLYPIIMIHGEKNGCGKTSIAQSIWKLIYDKSLDNTFKTNKEFIKIGSSEFNLDLETTEGIIEKTSKYTSFNKLTFNVAKETIKNKFHVMYINNFFLMNLLKSQNLSGFIDNNVGISDLIFLYNQLKVNEFNNDISKKKAELNQLNQVLAKVSEINDTNLSYLVNEIKKIESKLKNIKEKNKKISKSLNRIKESKKKIQNLLSLIEKKIFIEKLKEKSAKLGKCIVCGNTNYVYEESQLQNLENKKKQLIQELEKLNKISLIDEKPLILRLNFLYKQKNQYENLQNQNNDIVQSDIEKVKNDLLLLEKKKSIILRWKNGIEDLIKETRILIVKKINENLKNLLPNIKISIGIDEKKAYKYILNTYLQNNEILYSNLSTGQKSIMALSLVLSILLISPQNFDLLIFDEMYASGMDNENMLILLKLIIEIANKYKIMYIERNTEMIEKLSQMCYDNQISFIKYQVDIDEYGNSYAKLIIT